jgi:membrane protease YdiL (CAAX protease family)
VSALACRSCGALYKQRAAFCAACGQPRFEQEPSELRYVITFYITMLVVMMPALIYVVHLHGDPFATQVVASGALLVVILGFAAGRVKLWLPLYKTTGFGPLGFAVVLVVAPVVLALVLAYVRGLANAFSIHVPAEIDSFRGHHVMWMLGVVAFLPPLMEELAFRGVIYTGLRQTLGVTESMIISSFAFGLLHLAPAALLTHVPLGLYFCWLRERSGSLWPAMFAHCLHNLGVIVVERLGWG